MKKLLILISLIILGVSVPLSSKLEKSKFDANDKMLLNNIDSKFLIDNYQEITYYLLLPYLDKEIEKYYSTYLTDSPIVYPYYPHIDVLNIEKKSTGEYILKLRINSVIGPHIQVGTDDITLEIGSGSIKILKFEHIKSFELPDNYKHIIKKGYNNPIP